MSNFLDIPYYFLRKDDKLHVYPAQGREHVPEDAQCWCAPEVRGTVIVHRPEA